MLQVRPGWSGRKFDQIHVVVGFRDDVLLASRKIKISLHNTIYHMDVDIPLRCWNCWQCSVILYAKAGKSK
jgi:hypothetical protein